MKYKKIKIIFFIEITPNFTLRKFNFFNSRAAHWAITKTQFNEFKIIFVDTIWSMHFSFSLQWCDILMRHCFNINLQGWWSLTNSWERIYHKPVSEPQSLRPISSCQHQCFPFSWIGSQGEIFHTCRLKEMRVTIQTSAVRPNTEQMPRAKIGEVLLHAHLNWMQDFQQWEHIWSVLHVRTGNFV